MESKILGIRFTKTGKLCYMLPKDFLLKVGDLVVAESDRGVEIGRIVSKQNASELGEDVNKEELKSIIRPATKEDIEKEKRLKVEASDALKIFKEKIKKYELDMKAIQVVYMLDESKLIFYFTSEQRVDFRELVKELAYEFRTRIELRQVGARDEVKEYQSLGICGRELCCRTFLPDFESVTIKTAKEQGLQINMQKLSGCCGKLKCCIKYEEEAYKEKLKTLPKLNETVEFEGENAKVVSQDILKQKLKLKLGKPGEERFVIADVSQIKRINNNKKGERGEEDGI